MRPSQEMFIHWWYINFQRFKLNRVFVWFILMILTLELETEFIFSLLIQFLSIKTIKYIQFQQFLRFWHTNKLPKGKDPSVIKLTTPPPLWDLIFSNVSPSFDSSSGDLSIDMKTEAANYSGDPQSEMLILELYYNNILEVLYDSIVISSCNEQ